MSNNKQFKAGIWYIFSSFLIKGLAFITAPIFIRLLSVEEYGMFSSYNAWRNILIIITTLSVSTTINRARFDYEGKTDEYIASIATVSVAIPTICYLFVILNMRWFTEIMQMEAQYIHILFLGTIFSHIISIFVASKRVEYKYKSSVSVTVLNSVLSVGLAVVLVMLMENRLLGRVLGQAIPVTVIGIVLYVYMLNKGKRVSFDMIKYAIAVSWPMIPHHLAGNILSQSDRIIITQVAGSAETAYYSVACSCSMLIHLFINSLNGAWSPWLGEKIVEKEYEAIKKRSKDIVFLFFFVLVGVLLVAPDFLLVYGGKKYQGSLWSIVPLVGANMFQQISIQYSTVEQFEKKVWTTAIATTVAAAVNVALNYWLVPIFGYIAASYTTLVGYAIMCLINYLFVRGLKLSHIYDNRFFVKVLIATVILCFVSLLLYRYNAVRYIVLAVYLVVTGYGMFRYKETLKTMFAKRKK